MEQKVEFTAMELARALNDKGSIALHDILFDAGKATLKLVPEERRRRLAHAAQTERAPAVGFVRVVEIFVSRHGAPDDDAIVVRLGQEEEMAVDRIDSANDPRVAAYRGVRDGELLRSHGLFVAEGRHVVRRVIEHGRYRVQSMLLNEAALRDLDETIAALGVDVTIFVGAASVLAEIAGYDVHRGCLALVQRRPDAAAGDLIASSRALVILEAVSNADNVGGVFRNAAAFGADGVLLSPTCCDPFYRKAIRTSMGATLRVPFARLAAGDWPGVLVRVRAAGFTLVALTPREPSETLAAFAARPRPARVALIVGTEGAGLTAAVEAAADVRVRIPISGDVDSLNLATAVGIALHQLRN